MKPTHRVKLKVKGGEYPVDVGVAWSFEANNGSRGLNVRFHEPLTLVLGPKHEITLWEVEGEHKDARRDGEGAAPSGGFGDDDIPF